MISLPADFSKYTMQLMGTDLYHALVMGLSDVPPTSIRINPFKTSGEASAVNPALAPVPVGWCEQGYWLSSRPNFTFDPLLHAGLYYVQEAASMFVAHVISQVIDRPVRALDLCAAPGGKSTAARSVLPLGSVLICNEPIRQRAQILGENIQKFGHPDVIVTNNYPRDFAKSGLLFDLIIADVPCSGEGMFRKDPGAIDEWSAKNVDNCWQLQRQIVEDIWPCLRPGGILIYSTCTFNAKENENNIEWIKQLGAEDVAIDTLSEWHITGPLTGSSAVYRFVPGVTQSEGLCMAVLRKTDGAVLNERKAKPNRAAQKSVPKTDIGAWLKPGSDCRIRLSGDGVFAIPTAWENVYGRTAQSLRTIHAGIHLGTVKGHDLVPHQSLALSCALNTSVFAHADIDYPQAIAYLRKEAITLPSGTPRGLVLVTYHGVPIGFAKNLGNRANNLYPAEWRIKSTHAPENIPTILNI